MTLQDILEETDFDPKAKSIINDSYVDILRGLSYFFDVYEFAGHLDILRRSSYRVDGLHRYLFHHTKFAFQSFQFQINSIKRATFNLSGILRAHHLEEPILENFRHQESELQLEAEDFARTLVGRTVDLQEEETIRRIEILSNSFDIVQQVKQQRVYNRIVKSGLNVIDESQEQLDKLLSEYEARLEQDGLKEGTGGTLEALTIAGVIITLVSGIGYLLSGFGIYTPESAEDAGHVYAGLWCIGSALVVCSTLL